MRTKLACLITPLALLLAACGGDDGSADTTGADTTATDPTGTSAPTTDPTTETSVDPTDATTTVDPTDATTTVDPSTGPDPDTGSSGDPDTGTGTDTGGSVCDPDADDDECATCTKTTCCDQLEACYANPDCACIVDCVNMGSAVDACVAECGGALPMEALMLVGCTSACETCPGL